jgi:hypothetical protein
MTTPTHTPGPWEARRYADHIDAGKWYINGPEPSDQFLADVYPRHPTEAKGSVEANAKLIATAPRMLDCLKAIANAPINDDTNHRDALALFMACASITVKELA